MRLFLMLKRLVILTSLASCSQANPECHHWTNSEKQAMKQADMHLSKGNALHPLIRDYEAICIEQSVTLGPFTL